MGANHQIQVAPGPAVLFERSPELSAFPSGCGIPGQNRHPDQEFIYDLLQSAGVRTPCHATAHSLSVTAEMASCAIGS
jgi:hypothetical protein